MKKNDQTILKNKIYLFFLFTLFSYSLFSQNFSWIKSGCKTDCSNGVYPVDVATDNLGNIISTGSYYATATAPVSFDNTTLQGYTTNTFESNPYVIKYSPTGTIQWLKRIGTTLLDGTYPRVDADANGNIYAGVGLNGTAGGSTGDIDGTTMSSTVLPNDAVLVKFSTTGSLLWYRHFRGTGNATIYDVKTDRTGNVYVTGAFNGDLTVDNTHINGSNGLNTNFFIAQFNATGNLVWWKNANGTGSDAGYRLFVKGSTVYVLGVFADSNSDTDMKLDGTTYTIPNANYDASFIAKYTSAGTLMWFKYGYLQDANGGNGSPANYCDLVVDDSSNVYSIYSISPSGAGVSYLYPGSSITYNCNGISHSDYVMSKYDAAGTLLWAKGDGGSNGNSTCFPTSMIIHSHSELLVSYMISSSVEIHNVPITSAGSEDAVLARFDLNGNLKCHKQYGGTNQDWALDMEPSIDGGIAYTGHVFGSSSSTTITSYDGINIIGCRNTGVTGLISIPYIHYPNQICSYSTSSLVHLSAGTALGTFSSTPAGLSLNASTGEINASTSTPGTYTVSMTGTAGCDSLIKTTVSIVNALTSVQNVSICHGDTWYSPGPTPITVSGTYYDTVVASNGCDSVIITHLTVEPAINTNVSQNGSILTSNEINATYRWLDCNSTTLIPGAIHQSYTPSSNGSYAVVITKNGCLDTSTCYNITSVGINEFDFENPVRLFPNPANSSVNMVFKENMQNTSITLFNMHGQTIFQKNHFSGNQLTIDLSAYPHGIYFVEINSSGRNKKIKLIKE